MITFEKWNKELYKTNIELQTGRGKGYIYEDPLKTGIDLSWVFCSRNVPRELIDDSEETVWDESVMCPSMCLSVIVCSMCLSVIDCSMCLSVIDCSVCLSVIAVCACP